MARGVFWVIDQKLYAFPFDGRYPAGTAKSGKTYNHEKLWGLVRPKGISNTLSDIAVTAIIWITYFFIYISSFLLPPYPSIKNTNIHRVMRHFMPMPAVILIYAITIKA